MEIVTNRDATSGSQGGRAARILVADDNSNIQRMVALALKDHGIEVSAVGNGEAAVRALAQSKPDLILADVFMPVRNGYEVCAYVKNDSRYSHIPVILLLGAFDPLDESEAKRVGADGVLKKPFVPPDPMIALVKALLEKSAPKRVEPEPVAVAVAPEGRPMPQAPAPRPARPVAETPAPHGVEESPETEFPPMGRDAFETPAPETAHSQPHASATTEIADEDVLTGRRDAALGEPAFWHPKPAEEAAEESEPEEGAGEAAAMHEGAAENVESATEHPAHTDAPGDPFEIPAQAEHAAAAKQPETTAEPDANEAPSPDWSAKTGEWTNPAPPSDFSETPSVESVDQETAEWVPGPQEPVPALRSAEESRFAPAAAVWDDPVPAGAALEAAEAEEAHLHSWEQETPAEIIEEAESGHHAADEAAPDAHAPAANAAESAGHSEAKITEPPIATAPSVAPPAAKPTKEELVEAVVARVIEKLQPQIAEMINEEILRPVVSALVRRELENK